MVTENGDGWLTSRVDIDYDGYVHYDGTGAKANYADAEDPQGWRINVIGNQLLQFQFEQEYGREAFINHWGVNAVLALYIYGVNA